MRVTSSSETAVGGGQPEFDIRNTRDHHQQRPVDIAEAINCPPLASMLSPSLSLHLATAGTGLQVHYTALNSTVWHIPEIFRGNLFLLQWVLSDIDA